MRSTAVAVALAILFIAGMFALSRFAPESPHGLLGAATIKIEPGFKGVARIGPWILACAPPAKKDVPLPFTFGPRKTAAGPANTTTLGRCRAFVVYRRKADPQHAALVLTFRLIGQQQKLAVIVRLPPSLKKGDTVILQLPTGGLKFPVSACDQQVCLALGALSAQTEAKLLAQPAAQIVVPAEAGGKELVVPVPVPSLRAAVGAKRRAQAGE